MYLRTGHLFSTVEDIPLLLLHRTCHASLRPGLSYSDGRRRHRRDRAHDRQCPHRPCVAVEVAAERNVEAGRWNRLARQQAQPAVVFDRYEGLDRPPWGTAHPRSLWLASEQRAVADGKCLISNCYSACSPFEAVSVRSHSETWAGCIVSLTTPTRSPLSASRSVSSRNWAEKASRVFLASYFLL
jgi:hypothetical protein